MSAKRHATDAVILAALGAVFTGAVVLLALWGVLRQEDPEQQRVRTTYSTHREGTMAWYLLLDELGYAVRRTERPLLEDALAEADVLFVADPIHPIGGAEVEALDPWIRAGGVLVCAGDSTALPWDLHRIGPRHRASVSRYAWARRPEAATVVVSKDDGPLTRDVSTLWFWTDETIDRPGFDPDADDGGALEKEPQDMQEEGAKGAGAAEDQGAAADAADGPVEVLLYDAAPSSDRMARIATRARGKGRVIFLADSSFLANGRLGREDNAVLAVNLAHYAVSRARGQRVAVDEYHFGFGTRESGWGLMSRMLLVTGPGWAVLALTAAGVLYLVYRGRRFGTRRTPAPARRRSKLEYVHAVGATYRAAGAHRLTLSLIFQWFRRRVAERAAVPPSASVEEIARGLARRTGRPAARYERILGECEKTAAGSERISAHRMTVLLSRLSDMESEVLHER